MLHIGQARWRSEDREVSSGQIEVDVDAVGNFLRPGDSIGQLRKRGVHLFRRPNKQLIGVDLHPLFVAAERFCVHTQQYIVHRRIGLTEIMSIVRGDQR